MIEAHEVTKRYGATVAVDALSFVVEPGRVTGFLGPNGAGKTTTMRMTLGLDRPTDGSVTVNGRSYREMRSPLREVGALLDARAVHPGRRAIDHLLWLAKTNDIPRRRVSEVMGIVGIDAVAGKRIKTFSLGMSQRLGIASALLGDPGVLVLDEPVNGLDTEGIRWIRDLLRTLASQGRTVLLSSHLMSEMEVTADHVLVIGKGRLVADASVGDLIDGGSVTTTWLRTNERRRLRAVLKEAGASIRIDGDRWLVEGLAAAAIGELAAEHGIPLLELTPERSNLEEVYTQLVDDRVEFRAAGSSEPSKFEEVNT